MTRRHNRSDAELEAELNEQLAALQASCASYDAGQLWEAKRIAATLYLLLHDGHGKTKSLFTQLGGRDKFKYFTVLPELPDNAPPLPGRMPFIMVRAGTWGATCIPALEESHNMPWKRFVAFDVWWNETVFFSAAGERFSRKGLIIAVRNKDGGSHFDEAMDDEAYGELKRFNGMAGINEFNPEFTREKIGRAIEHAPNAHRATIRQIAWEILYSLAEATKAAQNRTT